MRLAIPLEFEACATSAFGQLQPGVEQEHVAIAHLSRRMTLNPSFRGMSVVRVRLLMSFTHDEVEYPCALVEWFKKVGRSPDSETGMWIVKPEMEGRQRLVTVIHLHSILRGAHLIPVYGQHYLPIGFSHTWSLDAFEAFHVNKYADHHANEIAF